MDAGHAKGRLPRAASVSARFLVDGAVRSLTNEYLHWGMSANLHRSYPPAAFLFNRCGGCER